MQTLDPQLTSILRSGQATPEAALTLFDALDPVDLEFMIGRWRGAELTTNHPMDGLLPASNWYGKELVDSETVHPLLFLDPQGRIVKVAPHLALVRLGLTVPVFKWSAVHPLLRLMPLLSTTEASQARLRMMEHRNKVSATIVYDTLPINDSFRRIDDNTVLGLMDFKDIPQPFFFVLRRD